VSEDAGLPRVVLKKLAAARPEQVLRVGLARVALAVEAGVDVERVVVLVEERERAEEVEVRGRERGREFAAEVLQVALRADARALARVLLDGALAPDRRVQPERAAFVNEVEEHLLVVAAQADDALRVLVPERDHVLDRAGYLRAAVNEIADEDDGVAGRVARDHFEEPA
jgi:hypothetical protein